MVVAGIHLTARELINVLHFKEIIACRDLSADGVKCVGNGSDAVALLYFKAGGIHNPGRSLCKAAKHRKNGHKVGDIAHINGERLQSVSCAAFSIISTIALSP